MKRIKDMKEIEKIILMDKLVWRPLRVIFFPVMLIKKLYDWTYS